MVITELDAKWHGDEKQDVAHWMLKYDQPILNVIVSTENRNQKYSYAINLKPSKIKVRSAIVIF